MRRFVLFTLLLCLSPLAQATEVSGLEIETPRLLLKGIPFTLNVKALNANGKELSLQGLTLPQDADLIMKGEELQIKNVLSMENGLRDIQVTLGDSEKTFQKRTLPGWMSLLPPLFAIALALISRQVLLSLFAGIWLGTFFLYDFRLFRSFFAVVDEYIVNSLGNKDHASVLIFTLMFGAMVAIIYRNGGTHGVVDWLSKKAKTRKGGQLSAWFLGIFIFFDDYANTLIVGNTMRPLTDRLKISREKLSFIVDSTAAPVASVALISSWIGTEVGLIGDSLSTLPLKGDAYSYFLQSIPFSFYPLLMLFTVFYIAYSGRDLWTMADAESRAHNEGKLFRDGASIPYDVAENVAIQPKEGVKRNPINAVLPIGTLILVTLGGLWITGADAYQKDLSFFENLRGVIGNADSYKALLWSSLSGCGLAILMSLSQRILSLTECFDAFVNGIKSMMLACMILVLAWAIGSITQDVSTNHYLTAILSDTLSPRFLPVLVFITAGLVSFSTGTSWGTMAILMPIVIPLAYSLGLEASLDPGIAHVILVSSISSVLAGSVWGDHCSPISDTTVMSSLASGCDHIDHVRTQFPYALLVGAVGITLGTIPTAFGLSPWISLILGAALIFGVVRFFGRKCEPEAQ